MIRHSTGHRADEIEPVLNAAAKALEQLDVGHSRPWCVVTCGIDAVRRARARFMSGEWAAARFAAPAIGPLGCPER